MHNFPRDQRPFTGGPAKGGVGPAFMSGSRGKEENFGWRPFTGVFDAPAFAEGAAEASGEGP